MNRRDQAADQPLDRLSLAGMVIDCVVGLYPTERHATQPLGLDVTLGLDTRRAARTGCLSQTVDYSRLCGEVRFILQASRFLMLEEAAEALASYILAPPAPLANRAAVQEVAVRLEKPQALDGHGIPALTIHRRAAQAQPLCSVTPFGHVETLYEANSCGLYRLCVESGRSAELYLPDCRNEAELSLDAGFSLGGKPVAPGSAQLWPPNCLRRYHNTSRQSAWLLACSRPATLPTGRVPLPDMPEAHVEPELYYDRRAAPPAA